MPKVTVPLNYNIWLNQNINQIKTDGFLFNKRYIKLFKNFTTHPFRLCVWNKQFSVFPSLKDPYVSAFIGTIIYSCVFYIGRWSSKLFVANRTNQHFSNSSALPRTISVFKIQPTVHAVKCFSTIITNYIFSGSSFFKFLFFVVFNPFGRLLPFISTLYRAKLRNSILLGSSIKFNSTKLTNTSTADITKKRIIRPRLESFPTLFTNSKIRDIFHNYPIPCIVENVNEIKT